MEKETITNYLTNHNELTYDGVEWFFQDPDYKSQRTQLLNAIDEIQKCVRWIVEFYVSNRTMRNVKSSYGLKFYVEKYFGEYVSNGSFVAAVELLRINHRKYEGDPNIYLPFNKNELNKYRKRFFDPRS